MSETIADATEAPDESATDDGDATTTTTDESAPEADENESWDPERARRKIAKLNSEAANLRKRLNETPKVEEVAEKDKRITGLEERALRLEVALDLGLPKEVASRLQGATRDDLVADAEALLALIAPAVPASRRPTPTARTYAPDAEPEETDLSKLGERMFRR